MDAYLETLRILRKVRTRPTTRDASGAGDAALRREIDALGTWFHNIDINGTPTKMRSQMGESLAYPASLWKRVEPALPDLRGLTVLDIGCNSGFFSLECKRRGAARVVGIDVNQGTTQSVLDQARFAADRLGLDIDYREQDLFDISDGPFDVVLFLGVLYHLEDPMAGIRAVANLTARTAITESLVSGDAGPSLQFHRHGWKGDGTTRWVPSATAIDSMLLDCGFARTERLQARVRDRYIGVAHKVPQPAAG
ncbi:MAG TPA: DUF1698 domain-containing protein [Candidatus Dormibacteraeota bacterium]